MKKTKQKRSYKFRAVIKKKSLYFYNCDGCGKKRSSRIYERALGKICQVCLKNKVPDNQQSLFERTNLVIVDDIIEKEEELDIRFDKIGEATCGEETNPDANGQTLEALAHHEPRCIRCNDNGCPSCEPTNGFNLKDGI